MSATATSSRDYEAIAAAVSSMLPPGKWRVLAERCDGDGVRVELENPPGDYLIRVYVEARDLDGPDGPVIAVQRAVMARYRRWLGEVTRPVRSDR